jgi:hypothetical protein
MIKTLIRKLKTLRLYFVRGSIKRKREKYWMNKEWMYGYINVHFID